MSLGMEIRLRRMIELKYKCIKSVCLYLIISAMIYMKAPAPLIIAGIEILEKIGYIIPQYC